MSISMFRYCLLLAFVSLLVPACSSEPDLPPKAGDACTIDADCGERLICRNDVCVERPTDPPDMGEMDMPETNNIIPPVEEEDYFISLRFNDEIEQKIDLFLLDSRTGEKRLVNLFDANCVQGCWVNRSLTHLFYLLSNPDEAGTFNVMSSPLNENYVAETEGTVLVSAVRRVRVEGDALTYIRRDGNQNIAYVRPVDGPEIQLGSIGTATGTEGHVHVDADSGLAALFTATLQTLDVTIGPYDQPLGTSSYRVDSRNYLADSGSYFGGAVATAFSADGGLMAFVTERAPLDTNACETVADCTGVGQRCGQFNRCAFIQVAVHIIDVNNLDNLGEPCQTDAACGDVHTCDIPSELQVDRAECVPRRVTLGLPGQQTLPGGTGCDLSAGDSELYYTDARGPLSFDRFGNLYLTAGRDCRDFNLEVTNILRISPTTGTVEPVYGNPGRDFDGDRCYDATEQSIDVTDCTIYIRGARLSPGGNDLVFLGSNPNLTQPSFATSTLDVWSVKRDGTNHAWIGGADQVSTVVDFRVHPIP